MNKILQKAAKFNFVRKHLFQYPAMESMLSRVVRGRLPSHWLSRMVPNPEQYAPNSIRFIERDNLRLELDLSDLMEWSMYYDFEDPSANGFMELCRPGNTVIDVGANIGSMSFKAAARIGESGQVYAFEPDRSRYLKCAKNLSLSRMSNIRLFNLGLGDCAGPAQIQIRSVHNHGMNQVVPVNPSAEHTSKITLATLDAFCTEQNLELVDVIKIDVEGYELRVLKGGESVLRKFRPRLFVEVDDYNLKTLGSSAMELIEYLTGLDYHLSTIASGKGLPKLDSCHFDLICLPINRENL